MKKFTMMAAVAAAALMAVPAVAHAEWYAGAAYSQYSVEDADLGGVTGRLGYRMNPNFAVEGEGTVGVDDDQGVELNHAVGAYAVGILPIGSSGFEAHGRVGYQTVEVDTPLGDVDDDGLAYGVGVAGTPPTASAFAPTTPEWKVIWTPMRSRSAPRSTSNLSGM